MVPLAIMVPLATFGGSVAAGSFGVDRGDFGSFKRSLNDRPYGYRVVEDPTGSAPTRRVERFEVRPGDCVDAKRWGDCRNDRERSELSQETNLGMEGDAYWYGWFFYLPKDFPHVYPTKLTLGQFHQKKSWVFFMFQHLKDGFYIERHWNHKTKERKLLLGEDELRGRWHRIEVHAGWSRNDSGFFRVYVNGKKAYEYEGKTMSARRIYFKYGVYRAFVSRYKGVRNVDEVPAQIAYYANVRRGKTREGLNAP